MLMFFFDHKPVYGIYKMVAKQAVPFAAISNVQLDILDDLVYSV